MKKKLPGKMSGLKPGGGGKPKGGSVPAFTSKMTRKAGPTPMQQMKSVKKADGGKKDLIDSDMDGYKKGGKVIKSDKGFKTGGKVNCYAEGGAVQMKTDYGTKDGGPIAAGSQQKGTARGMGAAKRGGNYEY